MWGEERKRRKREERLDMAIRVLRRALDEREEQLVTEVFRRELEEAVAAASDSDLAPQAHELLKRWLEMERHGAAALEAEEIQNRALTPCDACGSGELLVSRAPTVFDEGLRIRNAGVRLKVVIVVCRACGTMRWRAQDPSALTDMRTHDHELAFAPVSVGAKTPYR